MRKALLSRVCSTNTDEAISSSSVVQISPPFSGFGTGATASGALLISGGLMGIIKSSFMWIVWSLSGFSDKIIISHPESQPVSVP